MNPASILNQLKAESVLEDSHILTRIDTLRNGLRYKTDGGEVSFDDFFQKLQDEISELPRIELESTITPGTESQYQIQLVTALEQVFDDADRVLNRLLFFQSKLRAAQQQFQVLEVTFIAWYSIAVTEFLTAPDFKAIKLNATAIKALAQSEFGRLMEGVNIDVETILEVTKVLSRTILSHKTLAQEKYNLGKDQVNASWTSNNLPPEGIAGGEGTEGEELIALVEPEPEEENIPAFVSKTPVVNPAHSLDSQVMSPGKTYTIVPERNDSVKFVPNAEGRLGPGIETERQITEQNERATDELVDAAAHAFGPSIVGVFRETDEVIVQVGEFEIPGDSIKLTAVNAEGVPIPFLVEGGKVEEVILDAKKGELVIRREANLPSADDLDTVVHESEQAVAENSLLPPGVMLNATPLVEETPTPKAKIAPGPESNIVVRTKENLPDKIKCKNCHRRIRVNQLMFVVDGEGNWAHAETEDCTAGETPKTHVAATIAEVEQTPVEVKGTFKKYGEPMEITPIPAPGGFTFAPSDEIPTLPFTAPVASIIVPEVTVPINREKLREQILNNPDLPCEAGVEMSSDLLKELEQRKATPKPERKKITILPEDAEVV